MASLELLWCLDPMSSVIKYPDKSMEKTIGQQIIHFDDSCNADGKAPTPRGFVIMNF